MNANMRALVLLSAVVAAAVARPGSLEAVQSPSAGAASTEVPIAGTNTNHEADPDDLSLPQIANSLDNSVPESLKTPRLDNPQLSGILSDDSDDPKGNRFVDNPHVGLPFGTVLHLPDRLTPARVLPTAGTSSTYRIDSPHAGLPPVIPTLDSPAGTAVVNRPTRIYQTGTSPDGAFGNPNIHTEIPSKGVDGSKLSIIDIGGQPKRQFVNCVSPGVLKVFTPNSLPTSSPNNYFHDSPVKSATSNPPSHIPVNTDSFGLPNRSPNICPFKNIVFTPNNTAVIHVLSENFPYAHITVTAEGPVLVGGPFRVAVFPQQPPSDEINQVPAAQTSPVVTNDPAAGGPGFSPSGATAV